MKIEDCYNVKRLVVINGATMFGYYMDEIPVGGAFLREADNIEEFLWRKAWGMNK